MKKLLSQLFSFKLGLAAAAFYYLFISGIYAVMSLVRHAQFMTFGDLGIFNQAIWQYSQFKFPFSTFHLNRPILGDHFHPIIATIAPFYWLFPGEKTLLVLQPFIILSAIIPIFLIGYKLTKSVFFSLCVLLAYSLFVPLQYTIFFDFHEIIFVPPLFAWAYYFFLEKRKALVCLCLFLLLLVKEEVGFFVATFGLYLLLFHTGWRKLGFFWLIAGVSYSLFVISKVIPWIGGDYIYLGYGSIGQTPLDVAKTTLTEPFKMLSLLFDSSVKRETLHRTFWPFAYLPLLSPLGFLLSLEQFFTRFVDQVNVTRWTIGYHYSAIIAVVLPIATIWAVNLYTGYLPKYRKPLLVLFGILLVFLTRIEQINTSAVLLIKRPQFWARDSWMDTNDRALRLVPPAVSVATQRNLISHLSTREKIHPFKNLDTQAEYILADFHRGQSNYNFYLEDDWQKVETEMKLAISQGRFQVIFNEGDVFLLKRL